MPVSNSIKCFSFFEIVGFQQVLPLLVQPLRIRIFAAQYQQAMDLEEKSKAQKEAEKNRKLLEDLRSKDAEVVMRALNRTEKEGDHRAIPAMIDAMLNHPETKVDAKVRLLLTQLKTTRSIEPLIAAINDPRTKPVRPLLVSAFWESGLDVNEYLLLFVSLATRDSYLTCLECLTVIENMAPPLPETDLEEGLEIVKEALEAPDEKEDLLRSLQEVLQERVIEG